MLGQVTRRVCSLAYDAYKKYTHKGGEDFFSTKKGAKTFFQKK